MTWTITIPIDLPSANAHVVNGCHAATAARYRRLRDQIVTVLKLEARRLLIPDVDSFTAGGAPLPFRRVELVRLWGKGCRAWDSDNWVAAAKLLRDACQRERVIDRKGKGRRLVPGAGLVWDDSARWSSWDYAQERSADGKPGVRITITEGAA